MLSKRPLYLSGIFTILFSAVLGILGMILSASAACTNPSPLPTGFAAPCPVWSPSTSSVPQSGSLTLSATPQAGTDYILTTAYISQGTAWNPYTLSGNNAVPNYSSALASLTLTSSQLSALSLGTHYAVVWDWLWDAAAQCYKGPGLNQCNTGQWRVQSFSVTASYAYAQSAYYVYSQAAYASTPAVSISPTSLTFSSQTVGTTSPVQYLSVTNIGNATLTFTPATISGDFGFGGTASNICSTSLAPGVNCVFGILFKPTIAGTRTGTLTINDNASTSPQTALLNGTGVSTYSYSQSSYYAYSQSVYYAYSQAAYYAYSQSAYTSGTTYYVSPTGNDANTGSLSAP